MKIITHDLNHDLIFYCTATVDSQCLEYLGYITLAKILLKALTCVDISDIYELQCSNFGYICKFLHFAKLHVQSLSQIIHSCLKSLGFF